MQPQARSMNQRVERIVLSVLIVQKKRFLYSLFITINTYVVSLQWKKKTSHCSNRSIIRVHIFLSRFVQATVYLRFCEDFIMFLLSPLVLQVQERPKRKRCLCFRFKCEILKRKSVLSTFSIIIILLLLYDY